MTNNEEINENKLRLSTSERTRGSLPEDMKKNLNKAVLQWDFLSKEMENVLPPDQTQLQEMKELILKITEKMKQFEG